MLVLVNRCKGPECGRAFPLGSSLLSCPWCASGLRLDYAPGPPPPVKAAAPPPQRRREPGEADARLLAALLAESCEH